jgi:muconolactone D-isomerase
MEFLVRIQVQLPPEMSAEQRQTLTAAEARRGRELQDAGLLRRIWRVPGRLANVSLYEAPDATAVHEALSSLPLFPWIDAHVEPLAVHPLERTGDS